MSKHLTKLTAGLALGGLVAAAGTVQAQTVKIAYPNWAEGIAMTHLVTAILEDQFDVNVELTQADPGAIYASLANGGQDVMLDGWLPHTHEPYWDEFGDQLEDLGPNFAYGVTGLVVPAYMDIDSIPEINNIADEIDNEIIGIGTGAGIYRNTNIAIEEYDLDVEQVASSGPAMTAALQDAVESGEPIIVTGWKPHWKFGRFDLKVLDDPQGIYPIDGVKTIAREGFREDHPEIAQFLSNFYMPEAQLLDLMLAIDDSDDEPAAVARDWMLAHMPLVDSWIPRY